MGSKQSNACDWFQSPISTTFYIGQQTSNNQQPRAIHNPQGKKKTTRSNSGLLPSIRINMASKRNQRVIEDVVERINLLGHRYSDTNRGTLLAEAKALVRALETPQEAVTRMAWVEPVTHTVIRLAIELDIFVLLAQTSAAGKALTSADIAEKTGAERSLVVRILNHLSAIKIIGQPGPDQYSATELSNALTEPGRRDAIPWIQEGLQPSFRILPEFLREGGWKDLTDGRNAPFQKSFNTDLHMFDYLKQYDPGLHQKYKNQLAGYGMGRVYWTDAYPIREQTNIGSDGNVLFVDIGGNMGRDAKILRERFPDLKGSVVCQDLQAVIKSADTADAERLGVEMMAHDFFTKQPIKGMSHSALFNTAKPYSSPLSPYANLPLGAKFYFLHFVLHDWSNEDCIRILTRVREAMRPGYSKLIINELVIPSDPEFLHEVPTSLDWLLLAAHSAYERTEEEWRGVVEKAGFVWTGFWAGGGGDESVIEAEIKA